MMHQVLLELLGGIAEQAKGMGVGGRYPAHLRKAFPEKVLRC